MLYSMRDAKMSSLKNNACLIAFEGAPEAVTTQLRLLPASPNILVLPAIQAYLEEANLATTKSGSASSFTGSSFDARSFIRNVHEAAAARNRAAADFLRLNSFTKKCHDQRLVFLEGGTTASHALCVEAIRKHDNAAGGDLQLAALLFEELVAGGLAGLDASNVALQPTQPSRGVSKNSDNDTDSDTDPSTRAMRAAEALDKETESLQPANHSLLDLTRQRRHSLNLPIHGDRLANFGRRVSQASVQSNASSVWMTRSGVGSVDATESFLSSPFASPSSAIFPLSMQPDAIAAAMATTSPALGQSRGRTRWRARSLERQPLYSDSRPPPEGSRESLGDRSISFLLSRDSSLRPVSGTTMDSILLMQNTRPRPSSIVPAVPLLLAGTFEQLGGPSRNRQSPLPKLRLQTGSAVAAKPMCVDRGTDATRPFEPEAGSDPVLPLVEDLVIHFHDGLSHPVLDLAIARSRSMADDSVCIRDDVFRTNPATPGTTRLQPQGTPSAQHAPRPYTPKTPPGGALADSSLPAVAITAPRSSLDGYDPFAATGYKYAMDNRSSRYSQPSPSTVRATDRTQQPPTPAQTPPPTIVKQTKQHCFVALLTTEHPTAMKMQNALRAALGDHLKRPADGQNKHERASEDDLSAYLSSIDCDLWTPLLGKDGGCIDLILALGVQNGVRPALTATVMGRLLSLGATSSTAWSSRSGRLDIRYLVVLARQAQTTLKSSSNKDSAKSLAALIVPQLELYLRTHPSIRFLMLDYPVELLGVVFELQQLLGQSLLQVAALLAPRAKSAQTTATLSDETDPYARADLLLSANATELDISAFVASVHRRLVGTSILTVSDRLKTSLLTLRRCSSLSGPASPCSFVSTASSTLIDAPAAVPAPAMAVSVLSGRNSRLVAKTVQVSGSAAAIARERRRTQMERMQHVMSMVSLRASNAALSRSSGEENRIDEDDDEDEEDLDNDMYMRMLMPLFLREERAQLADLGGAGFQSRQTGATATKEAAGESSAPDANGNVVRSRAASEAQRHMAGDAIISQKALRWLGLE
ncbi:hypothetical protein CMQ_3577 [Grosmannia clavigera kw1407]|uniref:Gastric mucin-like protein n=1 Tax=Grosmannia clavigera (strain kw1407 / UAMH 11150) TaxID=655863 RepID=F0XA39_GROCL|nr:uncharacterized protein CMQ_3577 [Grosmannia clavigera kw1407]EFX05508.1 hypothetical protein CMQ_3577 [Grosmannia clavigera kw1407]